MQWRVTTRPTEPFVHTFIRPALSLLALFSLLCGVAYPLAVTGIAQAAFPAQANGSLVELNNKLIGSQHIAQGFTEARYFHPRPSAASFNASASSGSNLGPSSKVLHARIAAELARLKAENPGAPVPAELVYASASGLDPELSPAGARFQIARIAAARQLRPEGLESLIAEHTKSRLLGLLGEPVVNVLALNLALDALPAR